MACLWRGRQNLQRSSLLSKCSQCHTVWQRKRKCNFIYTKKKITGFPKPIFRQLTNAQKNYVQISYTKFQSNWAINVDSRGWNSFTSVGKVSLPLLQFSKNSRSLDTFLLTFPFPNSSQVKENCRNYIKWSVTSTAPISTNFVTAQRSYTERSYTHFTQIRPHMWKVTVEIQLRP